MTMGTVGEVVVSLPSGAATARVMTARQILRIRRGGQNPRPRQGGLGPTKVQNGYVSRAAQTLHDRILLRDARMVVGETNFGAARLTEAERESLVAYAARAS